MPACECREIMRQDADRHFKGCPLRGVATVKRQIDLKHHIDTEGRLIKSGNGVEVPEDEPLILFRARDRLALPMLAKYRQLCIEDGCNSFQLEQIDTIIEKFRKFAEENPTIMKQPGITRGL